MTRNLSTRIFTLFLGLIYLQGCATPYVLDQARGIKPISYGVENAWIDSKNQEFVLCLQDKTGLHKNKMDHFLIRIPKDIIAEEGNDSIDYHRRDVLKITGETNWWGFSSYADRDDIRVYDLSITLKNSCENVPTNFSKLDVMEPSKRMDFKEALSFTGSVIDEKIKTHKPFAIFVADPIYDVTLSDSIYICERSLKQPCLYLINKSTNYSEAEDGNSMEKSYSELLSINRIVWELDKRPLWYIALPLSIAIDAAIVMTIILIIGCAGGCGAG
ncbi:hypothetical protein A1353_14350 [Methylomonas methanica]|uniref:Uncharacterized protein n=1 Tax=Methylomonas methanica TaxID=421 RepID=A0A177MCL1_METMH|nr:hypothetical protein [Methylomonas methanica]OAI03497.1 hypothetical protein A1353_14350 [Methylomonas methanica]